MTTDQAAATTIDAVDSFPSCQLSTADFVLLCRPAIVAVVAVHHSFYWHQCCCYYLLAELLIFFCCLLAASSFSCYYCCCCCRLPPLQLFRYCCCCCCSIFLLLLDSTHSLSRRHCFDFFLFQIFFNFFIKNKRRNSVSKFKINFK